MIGGGYEDLFVTAADGLRLYARDYGRGAGDALPVVCLPGLARNSADFHEVARALSSDPERPRRVLALDYRGRGRSDFDPDWKKYDLAVEVADVLQVLAAAEIARAALIGTSRGGVIAMALATTSPALVAGAVLNDIGPVLEARGLVRIKGYVGKLRQPADYAEAGLILRETMEGQFPRLGAAQWDAMARATWLQRPDGALVLNYDPALARMLEALDLDGPLPDLWPLFEGLKRVPLMVIRGANSDLLSPETAAAMQAVHPDCETVTVPDQGHAPLLTGADLVGTIVRFVARVGSTAPTLEAQPPQVAGAPSP